MPKSVLVVLLLLIVSGLVYAYVDRDAGSPMIAVEPNVRPVVPLTPEYAAEPRASVITSFPDETDDDAAAFDEPVEADEEPVAARWSDDEPDTPEWHQTLDASLDRAQEMRASNPTPADDRERVVNVSISGSHVQVSSQGQVLWSRQEQTGKSADTEQAAADDGYSENPYAEQPTQSQLDATQQTNFQCPSSVYMGGNGYAVAMLKRAGCPKPDNYQGDW